jgi:hypothetical protein
MGEGRVMMKGAQRQSWIGSGWIAEQGLFETCFSTKLSRFAVFLTRNQVRYLRCQALAAPNHAGRSKRTRDYWHLLQ